jgi:hypothetical protein
MTRCVVDARLPPRPCQLDRDGHSAMRYVQRHRPDLSELQAGMALCDMFGRAVYESMEDDNARAIWRVVDDAGDVLLVVDKDGCVRTVLPKNARPPHRRPVK